MSGKFSDDGGNGCLTTRCKVWPSSTSISNIVKDSNFPRNEKYTKKERTSKLTWESIIIVTEVIILT